MNSWKLTNTLLNETKKKLGKNFKIILDDKTSKENRSVGNTPRQNKGNIQQITASIILDKEKLRAAPVNSGAERACSTPLQCNA